MVRFIRKQWSEVSANAKWDIIKYSGAAVIAALGYLIHKWHSLPDWTFGVILFLFALLVFLRATRTATRPERGPLVLSQATPTDQTILSSQKEENLQQRTLALSKEIWSWFIELGPQPPGKFKTDMSAVELQAANYPRDLWTDKLHHEFVLKFENRVKTIYHEFAARGVSNPIVGAALSNGAYTEKHVQALATNLGRMAADLNELDSTPNNTVLKSESTPAFQDTKGPRLLVGGANWLNLPQPMSQSCGYYFNVTNDQRKRKTTARGVKVTLRFQHIDGDIRESVGVWIVNSLSGMTWKKQVSIETGDNPQLLAMLYWGMNDDTHAYRLIVANKMSINPFGLLMSIEDSEPMDIGEWRVSMEFTGENLKEKWTTTMMLPAKGAITYSPLVRRSLEVSSVEVEH